MRLYAAVTLAPAIRRDTDGWGCRSSRDGMIELLRTNDLVKLSFLDAVLRDGGIETIVLDQHMSVLEGSAAAIPRRLMVADEDADAARRILREVGELDE